MYLLYPDLSGPHIPAFCSKILHPGQSELSKVSVLNSTSYQGHWYISLNPDIEKVRKWIYVVLKSKKGKFAQTYALIIQKFLDWQKWVILNGTQNVLKQHSTIKKRITSFPINLVAMLSVPIAKCTKIVDFKIFQSLQI